MLANRLRKNDRKLRKWARREGFEAYRVYDRDIPEVALAIDRYADHLHIAAYRRERDERPEDWLDVMVAAAGEALGVSPELVFVKERARQRGASQYDKYNAEPHRITVREGDAGLWVDLATYLDTGLFLDHRPLREQVAAESPGKRVLNLFAYTGSFTVHAAVAGARSSVSVDLSTTYLNWAAANLELNGIETRHHELVCADVNVFLEERLKAQSAGQAKPFDIAVLDPPTFSNSKKMRDVLDVQRDHARLCQATARLLVPGGTLYFSTNMRRFRLDEEDLADLQPRDISAKTIPRDFRNQRIHRTWAMTAPGSA